MNWNTRHKKVLIGMFLLFAMVACSKDKKKEPPVMFMTPPVELIPPQMNACSTLTPDNEPGAKDCEQDTFVRNRIAEACADEKHPDDCIEKETKLLNAWKGCQVTSGVSLCVFPDDPADKQIDVFYDGCYTEAVKEVCGEDATVDNTGLPQISFAYEPTDSEAEDCVKASCGNVAPSDCKKPAYKKCIQQNFLDGQFEEACSAEEDVEQCLADEDTLFQAQGTCEPASAAKVCSFPNVPAKDELKMIRDCVRDIWDKNMSALNK